MLLKLALKNLFGSGLRTWLNVFALSLSFVVIIAAQGFYNGINNQIEISTIEAQYGGGQYWHNNYDPFDPLTLEDSHSTIPDELNKLIQEDKAVPILIRSATIYPNGRIQNALLKGIRPEQTILTIPSSVLSENEKFIPVLIGNRMAKSTGLSIGDYLTVRWRDVNGTFDATEMQIVEIMKTSVSEVDDGQLWIPLQILRQMTSMPNQATMVVLEGESQFSENVSGWMYKDLDYLLKDARAFVAADNIGASIFYIILLLLAMLSIFDTQVLSIFRRRKEMGTLLALGLTRTKLIQLFTLEGALYAILAAMAAAIYGAPLLTKMASTGFGMPESFDDFGYALGNKIYPSFPFELIVGTTLLILIITIIVSYLPTRKISKLKPSDALRGKITK